MAEEIDHCDAWNVAHHRKVGSNLARAYIELRDLCDRLERATPLHTSAETSRLRRIITSNDT